MNIVCRTSARVEITSLAAIFAAESRSAGNAVVSFEDAHARVATDEADVEAVGGEATDGISRLFVELKNKDWIGRDVAGRRKEESLRPDAGQGQRPIQTERKQERSKQQEPTDLPGDFVRRPSSAGRGALPPHFVESCHRVPWASTPARISTSLVLMK